MKCETETNPLQFSQGKRVPTERLARHLMPGVHYVHQSLDVSCLGSFIKERMCEMLTQKRLKQVIKYDPGTGLVTERTPCRNKEGYLRISIDNKKIGVHQAAFLYMLGYVPKLIDHVNRNPADNRWSNLRNSNPSENALNSKIQSRNVSGVCGVFHSPRRNCWVAKLTIRGNNYKIQTRTRDEAMSLRRHMEEVLI